MLNPHIVSNLARLINNAPVNPADVSRETEASVAVEYFIGILQGKLNKCLNAEANNGLCDLTWKHEDCAILLRLLFELTGDDKYVPKYKYITGWD